MPISMAEVLANKLRQRSVMDNLPEPEPYIGLPTQQEPPLEAVSPEDFIPNPKSLVAVLKGAPAVLGMLAGPKSKMWKPTHAAAAEMELRARSKPEDVWAYSGYGKLPEGPMATEFSDAAAKLTNHPNPQILSDVLHHPELYKNYPGMKNVKFAFDRTIPGSGRHSPGVGLEGKIALNPNNLPDDAQKLQTLLHEAQHGIQLREGWVPGSNIKGTKVGVENMPNDLIVKLSDLRMKTGKSRRPDESTLEFIGRAAKESPPGSGQADEFNSLLMELGKHQMELTAKDKSNYKNNFGEANARLVEFRHRLQADTLRNRYPFDPDYFKRGTASDISDLIK